MTLCSPRFLFRLFTPLWMVSMWISVNFRINPFMHEVNDSSICLRIYSIDAIMQSKRQNFIQTTRPTLNKLARPPSWNDHSFSGTRQCCSQVDNNLYYSLQNTSDMFKIVWEPYWNYLLWDINCLQLNWWPRIIYFLWNMHGTSSVWQIVLNCLFIYFSVNFLFVHPIYVKLILIFQFIWIKFVSLSIGHDRTNYHLKFFLSKPDWNLSLGLFWQLKIS